MTALAMREPPRLLRFVIVGGGGAVLLFCLSWVFVRIGLSAFAGGLLAYALSFVTVYTAHRLWTFETRVPHRQTLPRYLVVQLLCGVLSGIVAHLAVHSLGAPPHVMSLLVTLIASAVSFVLTSRWAFAEMGNG